MGALLAITLSTPALGADEVPAASADTMVTDDGTVVYCVTRLVDATDGGVYGGSFVDCPTAYEWYPGDEEVVEEEVEQVEQEEDTIVGAPVFERIVMSGRGNKTVRFDVPDGAPAIATISHWGKSDFVVRSVRADGGRGDLLVNETGKYKGTRLINIFEREDAVAFRVKADGKWKVAIKPLASAREWDTTRWLNGGGDDVVFISPEIDGLASTYIQKKGKSDFAVVVYTLDGQRDLLVNETGRYDGEVMLPDGSLLLEIDAVGARWSMSPPQ